MAFIGFIRFPGAIKRTELGHRRFCDKTFVAVLANFGNLNITTHIILYSFVSYCNNLYQLNRIKANFCTPKERGTIKVQFKFDYIGIDGNQNQ